MKTLYWIFPCYNEEECLPSSFEKIMETFRGFLSSKLIDESSRLIFVDDGSKDKTWEMIEKLSKEHKEAIGIRLSRNKGHQYAVEAGLRYADEKNADFTITMDVDLQDDISVVKEMIEKHYEGYDVVYGVRNDRATDTFFKRFTANSYYKLMLHYGVELVENAADFRLISNRALKALLEYQEANLFLRGLVPQVGYPSTKVEYKRLEREHGKTHYPLTKMFSLATDGITAFSTKPLGIVGKLGVCLIGLSVIAMIIFAILNGASVLAFSIYYYLFPFISIMTGLLMICLYIIGLYIGKINIETKKRPHYFIQEIAGE